MQRERKIKCSNVTIIKKKNIHNYSDILKNISNADSKLLHGYLYIKAEKKNRSKTQKKFNNFNTLM